MKTKYLLSTICLLLFSITGCSLKSTSESNTSENDSEHSSQDTPDEYAESQLPKEIGNPHYLDLGELRDYSEVKDKYSISFIGNNTPNLIGLYCEDYLKDYKSAEGAVVGSEYAKEYKDDFFDEAFFDYDKCIYRKTEGTINGRSFYKYMEYDYQKGKDYYTYQYSDIGPFSNSVMNRLFLDNSLSYDYLKYYVETKNFIYLITEDSISIDYYGDGYIYTLKTTSYIEINKVGRLNAVYHLSEWKCDHNPDTNEETPNGFLISMGDRVYNLEFGTHIDYPDKSAFYDSIPDTLVFLDSIDITYKQCTYPYALSDNTEHYNSRAWTNTCTEDGERVETKSMVTEHMVTNPYVYVAIEEGRLVFNILRIKTNNPQQEETINLDLNTLKNALGGEITTIGGKQYLLLVSGLNIKYRLTYNQLAYPIQYELINGWPDSQINSIAYRTLSHYQGMLQR